MPERGLSHEVPYGHTFVARHHEDDTYEVVFDANNAVLADVLFTMGFGTRIEQEGAICILILNKAEFSSLEDQE